MGVDGEVMRDDILLTLSEQVKDLIGIVHVIEWVCIGMAFMLVLRWLWDRY